MNGRFPVDVFLIIFFPFFVIAVSIFIVPLLIPDFLDTTWEAQQHVTSNQSMKPTAPFRCKFSVFATTPCHGFISFSLGL